MAKPSFGVIFHPLFPPESLPDYARRAEAAGFDELWLFDDAFLPGALTSAAVALASTQRLVVGIGLLPVTAYNPLYATMELTTLARLYPGRLIAGFGYGVERWMQQAGAAQKPSLKALEETVTVVRRLLHGETVTTQGEYVVMNDVKMTTTPATVPPLYIGAMREKTLQLSGRIADGTIVVAMSSPEYVRWCKSHIGATNNRTVVFTFGKVNPDGAVARQAMRNELALNLPWSDPQFSAAGILQATRDLLKQHHNERAAVARAMPEAWIDQFSAAGTPEQAAAAIMRLAEAGADCVILQPLHNDPGALDEYSRYLMPVLKSYRNG